MKTFLTPTNRILFLLALIALSAACSRDRNHRGYQYFDDMGPSEAYEYYSENKNFDDGKTAQPPVAGTIARGHLPYNFPHTFEGQREAGAELINKCDKSPENIARGKEVYDICCLMCHGEKGKGDGHLFTSKKFIAKPADLTSPLVTKKPDGELYHVITVGSLSGLMGPHGQIVSPDDRWRVINYIREDFN